LGHIGTSLLQKAEADTTIEYPVDYCNTCGTDLRNATVLSTTQRQEVVIPAIKPQYINHITYHKTCCGCGNHCQSRFPPSIKAPVQYGDSIAALISYLSVYQYLPYHRITQMFKSVYGLTISEGTINNMLIDMAQKAMPIYEAIQQQAATSQVIGSDETGSSIGCSKGWFHTWQNNELTFIVAAASRGYKTIETYFKDGFKNSVYVSDCWAAQLKATAKEHQICLVHLLRETNNFIDALQCSWSANLKELLKDAIALKKQLTPQDYLEKPNTVKAIESRLQRIIDEVPASTNNKVIAFYKRIVKHQKSILPFLHHPFVPPDNNGSERAIRNVKIKTKVSTNFRTMDGAQRFAIIRSVTDTAIKNGQPTFEAMLAIAKYYPE
jgi:transposase